MEENFMLKYLEQLVQVYGFWAILLVASTVILMIPINIGIKHLFAKVESDETLKRLRKLISMGLVFVIAFLVLLVYVLITHKYFGKTRFAFDTLYIGVIAMFIWGLVKVIRDMGVKKLFYLIIKKCKNPIMSMLKQVKMPIEVTEVIYKNLCKIIEETEGDNSIIVTEQETKLLGDIERFMEGFVESDVINEEAHKIYDCLKEKYNAQL